MVEKASKTHFSVLMSVYSKEKPEYFDAALNSVLDQTLMPSEIVICEDGPITNELKAVIKKYKKEFPKIIRSISFHENRGLGLTLRDGVLACKNEIIFRMDTDDISVKDRFERQLKVFLEKDVDVLGSNIDEYDENMEKYTGSRIVPENDKDIKKFLKRRNPMNHQTVCFKKSKVLEAGNYQDMKYFEDYYLWVRMIENGCCFLNVQKSLVMVRGGIGIVFRRGSTEYATCALNFERELKKMKIINSSQYVINVLVRYASATSPVFLRKIAYSNLLRRM